MILSLVVHGFRIIHGFRTWFYIPGELLEMLENRQKDLTEYEVGVLDRLFDDLPSSTYVHSGGGSGKSPRDFVLSEDQDVWSFFYLKPSLCLLIWCDRFRYSRQAISFWFLALGCCSIQSTHILMLQKSSLYFLPIGLYMALVGDILLFVLSANQDFNCYPNKTMLNFQGDFPGRNRFFLFISTLWNSWVNVVCLLWHRNFMPTCLNLTGSC